MTPSPNDRLTTEVFADPPEQETARRLVACWNACRNLTTAQLEIVSGYDDEARLPWLAWYAQTANADSPFARQRT